MAGALDNIPFYSAFIERNAQHERAAQQQENSTLSKLATLSQLQAQMQARQKAEQMHPLQLEQLRRQIESQKIAGAEAARKAAFFSPENRAQFITQQPPLAPVTPNDDDGNPNPGVQQSPTFDFNKQLRAAAEQGIINPETYANHLAQREQARIAQEGNVQSRRDALNARLYDIELRSQDRNIADQTRRDLAAEANRTKMQLAALVASGRDTPHPIVGVDANGNQVVNFARPSQGTQTFDSRPIGAANIQARVDSSRAAQIQSRYSTVAKPIIDSLNSAQMYREFRSAGDFAQAGEMAAEALRRAARGGTARFKGEAGKLLGSGYGSGNIVDRVENYISKNFTPGGSPTKSTLAELDKLIEATENAGFENLARASKFFAAQVKGQPGMKLTNAIGAPFVSGVNVVFPDGTFAKYSNPNAADSAAQKWMESNQ